jgi:hypothetical protein
MSDSMRLSQWKRADRRSNVREVMWFRNGKWLSSHELVASSFVDNATADTDCAVTNLSAEQSDA